MKRTALVLLLLIFVCPAVYPASYSQIAMGAGCKTTVIVNNRLGTPFTGSLEGRKGNGEQWFSRQVTLDPYATFKITYWGFPDNVQVGYLEVVGSAPSKAEDVAVTLYYNYYIGDRLVDSIGIPRGELSKGHIFAVDKSQTASTAFAWSHFEPTAPFDIKLTYYRINGQVLEQKTVPFTGHVAKFVDEIFHNVETGLPSYIKVESPQAISMAVLRFETVADVFQLTAMPTTTFAPE